MDNSALIGQWKATQRQLRQKLIETDDVNWTLDPAAPNTLCFIGGVDISFLEDSNAAVACLVILSYPDLQVVYEDFEHIELNIPYIAGFLAFREALPFMNLINRVASTPFNPQVILVDGNGMLHPRCFGSACHLGVISGYPTIGVAKTLYCIDGLDEHAVKQNVRQKIKALDKHHQTRYGGEVLELRGDSGRLFGMALFNHGMQQTRNAIYVSVGHRVSLDTSVEVVKRCALFRIPEPVRQADLRSRAYIRHHLFTAK